MVMASGSQVPPRQTQLPNRVDIQQNSEAELKDISEIGDNEAVSDSETVPVAAGAAAGALVLSHVDSPRGSYKTQQ